MALVVAHPHPAYGGDRYNLVVEAVADEATRRGCASLRFDFRGVADPAAHGGGEPERHDVRAALDALADAVPEAALVLAGYSFGAGVVLTVADDRVAGWVAVAPVLGPAPPPGAVGDDPRPKLLLVPAHDQFSPPARVVMATDGWVATTIDVVEGADHLLGGHTREVAERAVEFALDLAPAAG